MNNGNRGIYQDESIAPVDNPKFSRTGIILPTSTELTTNRTWPFNLGRQKSKGVNGPRSMWPKMVMETTFEDHPGYPGWIVLELICAGRVVNSVQVQYRDVFCICSILFTCPRRRPTFLFILGCFTYIIVLFIVIIKLKDVTRRNLQLIFHFADPSADPITRSGNYPHLPQHNATVSV